MCGAPWLRQRDLGLPQVAGVNAEGLHGHDEDF